MLTQLKSSDAFILQDLNLEHSSLQKNKKLYVILIKQSWCGHCVKYFPVYKEQSDKLDKLNIQSLYIEGTESPDILTEWNELVFPRFVISTFPSLLIFNSAGKYIATVNDRNDLEQEVQLYLS